MGWGFIGDAIGAVGNAVTGAMGGAKDWLVGPGADPADLDRDDTQLEGGDAYRDQAGRILSQANGRAAPQAGRTQLGTAAQFSGARLGQANTYGGAQLGRAQQYGGTQVAPTATFGAAQAGPAQTTQAAQIAPTQVFGGAQVGPAQGFTAAQAGQGGQAQTYGGAQLGPAQQYGGTTIDQSQQAQIRQREQALADMLSNQASGQGFSVAGEQFRQAADANLGAQQALAASARGGGTALAGRQAAQNVSQFNQQAAGQAAIGRLQEQQAAQQALGSVLGQTRGADIGLATSQAGLTQQTGLSNMDAQNQFALSQAGFEQGAGLANAQQQNQFALQNAGFQQQANMFGAEQQNNFALQNAGFQQQTGLAGAEQQNQMALQQALLAQQSNIFGAEQQNQFSLQNAGFQQQAGMSNAQQQNQMAGLQAQLSQETGLSNVGAQNQFALQQGAFGQQAGLANMDARNQFALQQGAFGQQAGLANMDARNQSMLQQGSMDQQRALQNAQFQQTQYGMNDQTQLAALAQQMGISQAELSARMQQDALRVQQYGIQAGDRGMLPDLLAAGGTIGGAAAMSDQRNKRDIKPATRLIDGYLSSPLFRESREDIDQDYRRSQKDVARQQELGQAISAGAGMLSGRETGPLTRAAQSIAGMMRKRQADDAEDSADDERRRRLALLAQQQMSPGYALSDVRHKTDIQRIEPSTAPRTATKPGYYGGTAATPIMAQPAAQPRPTAAPTKAVPTAGGYDGTGIVPGRPAPAPGGYDGTGIVPPGRQPAPVLTAPAPTKPGGYDGTGIVPPGRPAPAPVLQARPTVAPPPVLTKPTGGYDGTGIVPPGRVPSPMLPPPVRPAWSTKPGGYDGTGIVPGRLPQASVVSDEDRKENIRANRMDEFLDHLDPYSYEYKDPERHGEGRHTGVMAQDLEKSVLGQEMVEDTPDGKIVDYGNHLNTMMASIAHLNQKIDSLKKRRAA